MRVTYHACRDAARIQLVPAVLGHPGDRSCFKRAKMSHIRALAVEKLVRGPGLSSHGGHCSAQWKGHKDKACRDGRSLEY
eukprot:353754-Chlamydomonas_euryale.AAC.2